VLRHALPDQVVGMFSRHRRHLPRPEWVQAGAGVERGAGRRRYGFDVASATRKPPLFSGRTMMSRNNVWTGPNAW
jgi:hypothetical protein